MTYSPVFSEDWDRLVKKVGVRGREIVFVGTWVQMKEIQGNFYSLRQKVSQKKIETTEGWLEAAESIALQLRPNHAAKDARAQLRFMPKSDLSVNQLLKSTLDLDDELEAEEDAKFRPRKEREHKRLPAPTDLDDDEILDETPFSWEPPKKVTND